MSAARAIGVIALNNVQRTARDRTTLFFAIGLPIVIMVVIGSTFGGMQDFTIGVVDEDGTAASADLIATVDGGDIDIERYDSAATLRRDIRAGSLAAGLVVPEGYGATLDAGDDVAVEMVSDASSASAAVVQARVRAAVSDEAVQTAAARAVTADGAVDETTAAGAAAELAADLPRAGVTSISVDEGDDVAGIGTFSYTAPSNLVLFTFVNTIMVGSLIAIERRQGITRRMLATPHGTGTILAGIGLAKLLFALLQSALIIGVGALLFDVNWGDPVAAAALVVLFALVATAVGLLVGAVSSGPDQASAIGVPVGIALAMLGGCMWPLEIVPPVMRAIGHITPHAWAMDGWMTLIFDGGGLADVAVELGVLALYAVGLGLLARRQLRRALTT
ncbi:MAG: ABC transporter permease [Acidimicrobiales bacterium]|nr:ABC transporter permease [Acidimicrobiales bacterium]